MTGAKRLDDLSSPLRQIDDAVHFSIVKNDQLFDQYTGTPVVGTGAELQELLDANRDREVYIIGSGENFVSGERMFRGRGIADVLESDRLKRVFQGRDGKTVVWKMTQ